MIEKEIVVRLEAGLEARPLAMFVQLASQFQSNIYVMLQDKRVNAKSIMGMMSLSILEREKIILTANGSDEVEATDKLEEYLSNSLNVNQEI